MTELAADESLRDRLVALTRDLVIIPSTASRPGDRERCYQFVRNHIDAIQGIEVREYRCEGFPSLVALPTDCSKPEVLLCAHLDVVGLPDEANYQSRIEDGRIYGPGAGDMKGQLTILLDLFRSFHHRYPGVSLGLAITADEEIGGGRGTGYLFGEVGLRCGLAIIPDGGSLDHVTVQEKGILHLQLTSDGHAGHAARPWLAGHALNSLLDSLAHIRQQFAELTTADEDHWYPTCAVTVLRTDSDTINRIPGRAEALLDIRFPPPHTTQSMLDLVRRCLGSEVAALPMIASDPTHLAPDPAYLDLVREMTGNTVRQTRESGGSDARFIARHGIPVIVARPLVGNLHSEDEWIDVGSMLTFHEVCARYLHRRLIRPQGG